LAPGPKFNSREMKTTDHTGMRALEKLHTAFDRIIFLLWIVAGILLLFTICSVILDVILRMTFPRVAMPWVVEVNEYVLFGMTFFASAWCLRIAGHIRVDFIFNAFKPPVQHLISAMTSGFASLSCLVFSYYGAVATLYSYQKGTHIFKFLKVPKYCFSSVLCLCSFFLAVEFIKQARYHGRERQKLLRKNTELKDFE